MTIAVNLYKSCNLATIMNRSIFYHLTDPEPGDQDSIEFGSPL